MPERVAQEITVAVRLFASYRESAGAARLEAELSEGARVRDLQEQLAARVPALTRTRGLVAVNQTYVGPDFVLHAGDEVAFIPPVSGGSFHCLQGVPAPGSRPSDEGATGAREAAEHGRAGGTSAPRHVLGAPRGAFFPPPGLPAKG